MMKCKDCKHYNGATMPGAGLCNATQARTFATTVCFNGLFTQATLTAGATAHLHTKRTKCQN